MQWPMDVDFVKYLSGKSSKLLKVKHHDILKLNNNRQRDEDGRHERNGKFIRLPCQSERYIISLHHARRTGRGSEIPVSWILRKLFKMLLMSE